MNEIKLPDLIEIVSHHSKVLADLYDRAKVNEELLDAFTDALVRNYELIKWLFKQLLKLGEWQVGRDKDGKLLMGVERPQNYFKREMEKRLTELEEQLEGFRIYTLSTLKEIKEPPIKKKDVI